MDEVFNRMFERKGSTTIGYLPGMSGGLVGQIRDGTWEVLAGPAETRHARRGKTARKPSKSHLTFKNPSTMLKRFDDLL
jgi:hypothetical protein